ncbi:hypothetical protein BH11CYA1_BH11CYA1_04760 [soil metagenome]
MFKRIRKTLRSVRYSTLSNVIGKQVLISSAANASSEVTKILQNEFRWLDPTRLTEMAEVTLPKYGLLDLSFSLVDQHETNPLTVKDLKNLGGFPSKNDRSQTKGDYSLLPEFHEQICEEAEMNSLNALFFLTSDAMSDEPYVSGGSPDVLAFTLRYPQIVTVKDACITNAESIWTLKYFYM